MIINTQSRIKLAIARIEKGNPKVIAVERKLSIASVAEEAGIHRTTIINRYPLLADIIRDKSGMKTRSLNSDKQKILDLQEELTMAKVENSVLKDQLAKAVSLQAKKLIEGEDI